MGVIGKFTSSTRILLGAWQVLQKRTISRITLLFITLGLNLNTILNNNCICLIHSANGMARRLMPPV